MDRPLVARLARPLALPLPGRQAAVRACQSVAAVHVAPSFPHGLRIEVVQRSAVAALVVGGVRTAVSSDGIALGMGLASGSLPTVAAVHEPITGARVGGT